MDRIHVMQLVRSYQVGTMSRREFLIKATTAIGSLGAALYITRGDRVLW